jgi:hypothetical protein
LVKVSQLLYLFIMFFATACSFVDSTVASRTPIGQVELVSETALPAATATLPSYPWVDESSVVSGVCFEAASDMAAMNRRFVLHTAQEHIEFYNAIDSTNLCLRPVQRVSFDFDTGRALAGLWSAGRGCMAEHEVMTYSVEQNTLNIALRFVTQGDCNYELIRPFWISFDGSLTLNLTVDGS